MMKMSADKSPVFGLGGFKYNVFRFGIICIMMVTLFWVNSVRGADTGFISATVVATNLAVSVSDGSIAFGSVALNTATSTVGTAETQTVSNDGSNSALNVKSSNATGGTTWTLGTTPGSDVFKLELSTTTGSTFVTFQATDTYLSASSTFSSLTDTDLDFRFTSPTASSDFVEKNLTITVQVTTP